MGVQLTSDTFLMYSGGTEGQEGQTKGAKGQKLGKHMQEEGRRRV